MEDLSDAFFLDKLLVLPANVKLDWKVIARYIHSSLFGIIAMKKFFLTLTPGAGGMNFCFFSANVPAK